ncbi:hypothetical protein, partial [Klebsiella pneumoniae]|uniref:hypothetical protein n=1 Tax=Klebsiella pneumoniae TaxID=573 RepID=UPI001953A527
MSRTLHQAALPDETLVLILSHLLLILQMADLSASVVTASSLTDQLDSIEQLLQSGHGDKLR